MSVNTKIYILLLLPLLGAAHQAIAEGTVFEKGTPPVVSSGVILRQPLNGQYIYKDQTHDKRIASPAIMVERPERADYVFLSAQEEQELFNYKQDKLEEEALEAQTQLAQRSLALQSGALSQHKIDHHPHVNWPRVVIQDDQSVCVPEVEFAQSKDWKQHLTCTQITLND